MEWKCHPGPGHCDVLFLSPFRTKLYCPTCQQSPLLHRLPWLTRLIAQCHSPFSRAACKPWWSPQSYKTPPLPQPGPNTAWELLVVQCGGHQSCITVLSNPAFFLSFPYVSSRRLLPKRLPAGSSWPLRPLPGTPPARGSHLGMRHLHVFTLNPLAFFITNFYFQATENTRLKAGTLTFSRKILM